MSEEKKSIKEEMDEQKESKGLKITITLTDTGYIIETSSSIAPEYLMSTLETVSKDLFVRHIYERKDAPWMRKFSMTGKKQ